jgi:hypothetical protein
MIRSILVFTVLSSAVSGRLLSLERDEESPFDGFLRVREKILSNRTQDDLHRQVKANRAKNRSKNIWDTTLYAFSKDTLDPPLMVTVPDPSAVTADLAVYESEFAMPFVTTSAFTTSDPNVTTFYAIGDVPYNNAQAVRLQTQMMNVAPDAEFLIHIGDIRYAGSGATCTLAEFQAVEKILRNSRVPVFIVPGDNEYNDCPNINQAWTYWKNTFLNFERKYWPVTFNVTRQPNRPENFAFVNKKTMFVGLNIVGGRVHSSSEWTSRLTAEETWMENQYKLPTVLFAHAEPTKNHAIFFDKLIAYFKALNPQIPMLYLNGDLHT